jgi:hypothetical protein
MPVKNKIMRATRRSTKLTNKSQKNRIPAEPVGMPRGKHLTGFKGMKVEGICMCGGCNPKALANKNKVVYR